MIVAAAGWALRFESRHQIGDAGGYYGECCIWHWTVTVTAEYRMCHSANKLDVMHGAAAIVLVATGEASLYDSAADTFKF